MVANGVGVHVSCRGAANSESAVIIGVGGSCAGSGRAS